MSREQRPWGQSLLPWGQSLLQDSRAEVALDVTRVTGQSQACAWFSARSCSGGGRGFFPHPKPFLLEQELGFGILGALWKCWKLLPPAPIQQAQGIVEGTRPESPGMQIWVFQWHPGFPAAAPAVIGSGICSTIHIHELFPALIPPCVSWECGIQPWESSRVPISCWEPVAAQFGLGLVARGHQLWFIPRSEAMGNGTGKSP